MNLTVRVLFPSCWKGTTAAATLGSAPAAGGSAAAGNGLSRTLIIVISVCVTFGGVLLIAVLVWGVIALARRHEDDLPAQETSVAMSSASGGYWRSRADSGSAPSRQTMAGSSSLKY
ncbi:g5299 [Coccomyxa elongata]